MISQEETIRRFAGRYEEIREEIGKEMIGQAEVVEHLLLAVIAGGNVLLEGVPGLGKTHLVRVLSKALDPVYAGPDAGGHYRYEHPGADGGGKQLPFPKGAAVQLHRAGGRDQPRDAQDPGGAA
jgi:hypothetical protein